MSRRRKAATIITSLFILSMVPVIGTVMRLGNAHAAPNGAPASIWTALQSPSTFGSTFDSLHVDPTNGSIVYALDSSGSGNLWKSTDHGTSWTQMTGLPTSNLTTSNAFWSYGVSTVNHLMLYALSSTGILYQSPDGGTTWITLTESIPSPLTINKLLVDPNNGNQLYVEDKTNDLIQSIIITGSSAIWTSITGTVAIANLSDIILDTDWTWSSGSNTNSTLILVTAAGSNGGGGTTGTGTFTVDAYLGSTVGSLNALVTTGRFLGTLTQTFTIAAFDTVKAIARLSYGAGDTLYLLACDTDATTVETGINDIYFASTTASTSSVMAASGVTLADAAGTTNISVLFFADPNTVGDVFWYYNIPSVSTAKFGFSTGANATSGSASYTLVASTSPTTIVAGTVNGSTELLYARSTHVLYTSLNPTALTAGVSAAVFAPAMNNANVFNTPNIGVGNNLANAPFLYMYGVAGSANTGFAYLYSGASASTAAWSPSLVNSGQVINQIAVDPVNQNIAYALSNNGLYTTANGGISWTQVAISGAPVTLSMLAIDATNDKHMALASTSGGNTTLYESINSGATWYQDTVAGSTSAVAGTIDQLAFAPSNGAVLYAVMNTTYLYVASGAGKGSTGANFTQMSNSANYIAIDPHDATGMTVFADNGATSILSSTNGGANWTILGSSGFAAASDPIVEYSYGSTQAVIGQSAGGPNYTTTAGATWTTDFAGSTLLNPFMADTGYNTLVGIAASNTIYYQAIPQAPAATATATATATNTPVASTAAQDAGVYDAMHGMFFLDYSNAAGNAGDSFNYGPANSTFTALAGYWSSGQTLKTPGLFDPATGAFYLKNTNTTGNADETFIFGSGSNTYKGFAGKWTSGAATSGVGLYNPTTGMWFLKNTLAGGNADISFQFGPTNSTFLPIVGDWTNRGFDAVGLYDPATGTFYLRNVNAAGVADATFVFGAGNAAYIPVAGRWVANSATTVGLYNARTGSFFLKNTNTAGNADATFSFGAASLAPMAGNWH